MFNIRKEFASVVKPLIIPLRDAMNDAYFHLGPTSYPGYAKGYFPSVKVGQFKAWLHEYLPDQIEGFVFDREYAQLYTSIRYNHPSTGLQIVLRRAQGLTRSVVSAPRIQSFVDLHPEVFETDMSSPAPFQLAGRTAALTWNWPKDKQNLNWDLMAWLAEQGSSLDSGRWVARLKVNPDALSMDSMSGFEPMDEDLIFLGEFDEEEEA